jgi:hypothetical protein
MALFRCIGGGNNGSNKLQADYSGLSYAFLDDYGSWVGYDVKTVKIDVYSLKANNVYTIVIPKNVHKNRQRVSHFGSVSVQDFYNGIENPLPNSTIYTPQQGLLTRDNDTNSWIGSFFSFKGGVLIIETNSQGLIDTEGLCYDVCELES